jgi:hypothetical protein
VGRQLPALLFQTAKLAQHAIAAKFDLRIRGSLISCALVSKQKVGSLLVFEAKRVNMSMNWVRQIVAVTVLVSSASIARHVDAQCCGATTTAFYQPVAYTAYSPVAYTTYRTGWYPGYYLDRVRARLWGAPATYVASYPSTYVASYPATAYYASYPAYTSSYSTCSSCVASPQVTLRPVCTTCGDVCTTCNSCSGCSTCGSYGVSQTSYESSAGCASCGVSSGTVITTETEPGAPAGTGSQPELSPTFESTPRGTQKPADIETTVPEPDPATTNSGAAEETQDGTSGENGALLEAPELFGPNGRTAMRGMPPVRKAVYEQPVSHRRVSAAKPTKITAEQAARDAVGWRSASK